MRTSSPSIVGIVVSVLGALWLGGIGEAQGKMPDPSPPGTLVDVGGWRMHIHCAGTRAQGAPTVILDAGAGDSSIEWTRVLVGHSMAGRYARMFASAYRELTAGLVLVDANHEDDLLGINGKLMRQWETATGQEIPPVKTSTPLRLEDLRPDVRQQIDAAARQANSQADFPPYSKLPPDARAARIWAWSQPKHFAANNSPFDGDEASALRAERQHSGHHIQIDEPAVVVEAVGDVVAQSTKR